MVAPASCLAFAALEFTDTGPDILLRGNDLLHLHVLPGGHQLVVATQYARALHGVALTFGILGAFLAAFNLHA